VLIATPRLLAEPRARSVLHEWNGVEIIMRKFCTLIVLGSAVSLSVALTVAPADARRGGGGHHAGGGHARHMHANVNRGHNVNRNVNRNVSRNVDRNINRNVNRDRRYVYHNGRRGYWRNGVFVVAPAVAGATYVASCAYEYGRWQSTGSSYWRDRYYSCAQ
jgi:hypothetical protein